MAEIKKLYSKIAGNYDGRYKQQPMARTLAFLKRIIASGKYKRILEVGCGTGYWISELASGNNFTAGLDISKEMISNLKLKNQNVFPIVASSEYLPFKQNVFDFIFLVNAIHHFTDKQKFIEDVRANISAGGKLTIIAADILHPEYYWYIYDYFKSTFEFDSGRIPSPKLLVNWMREAGFNDIQLDCTDTIEFSLKGKEVFNDHFINKTGNSTLAQLSDEHYNEGLAKIKNKMEIDPAAEFKSKIIFTAVTGTKN